MSAYKYGEPVKLKKGRYRVEQVYGSSCWVVGYFETNQGKWTFGCYAKNAEAEKFHPLYDLHSASIVADILVGYVHDAEVRIVDTYTGEVAEPLALAGRVKADDQEQMTMWGEEDAEEP